MKRIFLPILLLVTLFFAGCGDDSGDDPATTGSITINATYTGSLEDATDPGSKKIYVYLYSTLADNAQDATNLVYQTCTDAAAAAGEQKTLTISNIAPGSYYAVVFYDYKTHNNNIAGNGDRYVIYNATPYTADAAAVTVTAGSSETLAVSFGDDYTLQSGGSFLVKPGTVTVTSKYTGTAVAGAKLYVNLYTALSDINAVPAAQGSTSADAVTDGVTANTITLSAAPGTYYVVALYDFNTNGVADQGDKYTIYSGVNLTTAASTVTVTSNQDLPLTIDFTDANSIQAAGAFMGPVGSVTLNVTYTGPTVKAISAPGSKQVYAYLYSSSLPINAKDTTNRKYVGEAAAVSVGSRTITINNVTPGDYYMVVFYDRYQHDSANGVPGKDDFYAIYDSDDSVNLTTNLVSEANTITVTADTNTAVTFSFGDTYALDTGAAFDLVK